METTATTKTLKWDRPYPEMTDEQWLELLKQCKAAIKWWAEKQKALRLKRQDPKSERWEKEEAHERAMMNRPWITLIHLLYGKLRGKPHTANHPDYWDERMMRNQLERTLARMEEEKDAE